MVVADLNREGAEAVADEIEAAGGKAHAVAVDVSDFSAVEKAVQSAVDACGRLDGIFNNAGIAYGKPLLSHEPERDYHPMIRIDQDGVYYGILAAARQFVKQGAGSDRQYVLDLRRTGC
ncbi:SDR family NAD(P)-dependent oxidoreductase [Nesterenkonia pannonica]|uniref:SDR family NAD(P)-dependent oxidoreductase n=1 Tax=Nesterenkonia pannonica TaxID=1548602 RepID=UPI0021649255|nr:SDR family NAD(P)-dependent oxidoreductase [Nesterenkonia pannonica]